MKGRNKFTQSEIDEIKRLIKAKESAGPDKQKGIRNLIRKIGFYYSDFRSQKEGYTVTDFQNLLNLREIIIVDRIKSGLVLNSTTRSYDFSNRNQIDLNSPNQANLTPLLSGLKKNRFDPSIDSERIIPNSAGNYLLCLKKGSSFPDKSNHPIMNEFDGLKVIYTGIASKSLRERDFKQHFTGNNAGRSTLRKSIGVLFGYKQIPRDKDPSSRKTKFNHVDELELSRWMKDNLIMFYFPTLNFDKFEKPLIQHFNPPLNLKDNQNTINLDFRQYLKRLRNDK